MGKIYTGTTLTNFRFHLGEDVTGYTADELLYTKPDTTTGSFSGSITQDNPGIMEWSPANATDLDLAGTWEFQPKITLPSGVVYGEKVEYEIYDPIT